MESLEACRLRFAVGDNFSLLKAIRICANRDLVMPDWVARAFISRFDRILNTKADSWDEVFGRPHPKGQTAVKLHKRRSLRAQVFDRVQQLHEANPKRWPISDGTFEQVGEEFGIKKTQCNKLYYAEHRALDASGRTLPPTLQKAIMALDRKSPRKK
ncbi:MAG: hypothetical protein H0U98_08890 [Alphaproteobacteria bacterium]|nr:hypothetical protein [Alphaproteobacteria bacterium]